MSASPSTSPPRTPGDNRLSVPTSTTPNSDDSSIIDDLSFDYICDPDGNIVRLSKGSSHSSPPTPKEALQPDPPGLKPPSPDLLASPIARISLSRSESAYSALTGAVIGSSSAVVNEKPSRSFQRVASGPALSIGPSSLGPSYLAPTASSLSKPRVAARRITMEDGRERQDSISAPRTRQTLDANSYAYSLQEEKENISESEEHPFIQTASVAVKLRSSPPLVTRSVSAASTRVPSARAAYLANGASSTSGRPLTEVPQRGSHARQLLPAVNRAARIMKSSSASKYGSSTSAVNYDRISEADASDNEQLGALHSPKAAPAGGDDTEPEDEPIEPAMVPLPSSRPRAQGLSINVNPGLSSSTVLTQSGNTRPRRSASLSDALSMFPTKNFIDSFIQTLNSQRRLPSAATAAVHEPEPKFAAWNKSW